MNEFLGVLRCMMGVHGVMLVGYEKGAGVATSMYAHFALLCDYIHTLCPQLRDRPS